jgi:hypothetical protein
LHVWINCPSFSCLSWCQHFSLPFEQLSFNHVLILQERIIINLCFSSCIKFKLPLLNGPLNMLPKNSAIISSIRSSIMVLVEFLILQLLRR